MHATQPIVLTIAGSDSSGGAGIQADLRTFAALGCYGTSVITALTAQNTRGVQAVHGSPPEFVGHQVSSVLEDLEVQVMKTGMLFDAGNTRAVVRGLKEKFPKIDQMPPLICDPVCVSTSGHDLLHRDAVSVMITELFPLSTLITPNKAEAERILAEATPSRPTISTLSDMVSSAKELLKLGPKAVLLKGGHLLSDRSQVKELILQNPEIGVISHGIHEDTPNVEVLRLHSQRDDLDTNLVVDVLCEQEKITIFTRPRIDTKSTHGTGCTLSAAIVAELAYGLSLSDAVGKAAVYTHLGIESAIPIGHGHGPLNHLHSTTMLAVPRPSPSNTFPLTTILIHKSTPIWKSYVEHEFVRMLGLGVLDKTSFVHFIKQDYHYLRYYARAYALLASKATSFPAIGAATGTILGVLNEIGTHKAFCAKFGVTADELEQTVESPATMAYGAYLIDSAVRGDAAHLIIALFACLIGYGEVGLWLKKNSADWVKMDASNPYLQWIEDYSGEQYQGAVKLGLQTAESLAAVDPPSQQRLAEWCDVFSTCTRLEKGFWDMAITRT